LFHWLLVLFVVALIVTGNMGGDMMTWHARCGFAVLTLVLFRLGWGFWGGHWSRFKQFDLHPQSSLTYVRNIRLGAHSPQLGHNPVGAWSVCAVLLLLTLQIVSGMVADDEISFTGPFNQWVSGSTVSWATWYHKAVGKKLLLAWFALHLMAMLYHRWRFGENLVTAMFSGNKWFPTQATASQDRSAHRIGALIALIACALLVGWLVNLPNLGSP
jgi:cytochrome b